MNCIDFLISLKNEFNTLGVNDILIKDNTLIIPIDEEEGMPSYKIAITMIEEGYLSIYTSFKHNAVLKKELVELLKVVNTFNEQSFLKFIVKKEFVKVEYNIAELEKDDVKKVIRVISIIPNILFEFYRDLVKYLA
jgi:hypothetical protein